MAKYGSDKVGFFLIDGYDPLGVTTTLTDGVEAVLVDTTVLGSSWMENGSTGIRKAELTQSGFYDDTANGINDALVSTTGTSRVVTYTVEGNTVGKNFVGWSGAVQVNYQRVASRGDLHRANAKYTVNGSIQEGKVLHALGQENSNGNTQSTSVDNGASSASGGAGFLEVKTLNLGGRTDITTKVQHSADNVTFTDLLTFTAVTTAPKAERKTVSGTVNRYLAAWWTFTGSGSGQYCSFMMGFARN